MADVQVLEIAREQAAPVGRVARLRALRHEHPLAVWLMALCNLTLWTGRGMVMPFLVIYFSQIVGLSASMVGSGIAISALGGIVFVMFVAGQIDRRGGRPILLCCLSGIAVATFIYPWGTNALLFVLFTVALNFAGQLYWPASDATLASLTEPSRVAEAMSILRVANAVGVGAGGLIGGLIVSGGGMSQYRVLFIVSATMIGAAALLVWRMVPAIVLHSKSESGEHGTWGDLLPDRLFIYTQIVLFALIFGFSQMSLSIPAFLREEAGISEGIIGALFSLNTLIVILIQIPIAGRVNRGNIGRLLALGSVFWALAFGLMLTTPSLGLPGAIAVFLAFTGGELIFMPVTAVIPVRLAPLHLRGRYFAMSSVVWGAAWSAASLAAGFALDLPQPAVLWPIMVALMLAGAVGALRMGAAARLHPNPRPDTAS